jgi:DNA-binding NtrC family response regulator
LYQEDQLSRVLIIDDDFAVCTSLSMLLQQNGFPNHFAKDPLEAIEILHKEKFDLIVMDMNFSLETSGTEGLQLLAEIKQLLPAVPVILITAWGSIELAVKGMKLGAVDFITKPWSNDHFIRSVNTAISLSENSEGRDLNRQQLEKLYDLKDIIGSDPKFIRSLETICRISDTDASILILGESGTGKELIAEAIHKNSRRNDQPFVKVNLGGISSTLFESEMFGHVKGAFTDARNNRIGRFEMADRGSIFLDEIGELDLSSQVKLLRVLQDQTFEVLGSSRSKSVDVRIISATNRDILDMVESNEFREDLFYRINLITVEVPPLRDRPADIPLLVNHFLIRLRKIYKRPGLRVTRQAMEWLTRLSFPGNIRELKNLVERVVLVSPDDEIDLDDFTSEFKSGPKKASAKTIPDVGSMTINEVERKMILKALDHYDNNITKVAKSLGLSRAALYRRMQKFDIEI